MKARLAVCLDNSAYPASPELHKIYRVLPDEDAERDGDIRIVDESGEDYLYPAKNFALIDLPDKTERILMDSFARHVPESLQNLADQKGKREKKARSGHDPFSSLWIIPPTNEDSRLLS